MSKTLIVRIAAFLIIGIVLVGVIVYTVKTPKQETSEVENIDGYSTITSVAGCSFLVNDMFSDQATAVTQISEGVNFSATDYYSYKDGKNQYMLFCMDNTNGIVVAVEKDTHFSLQESEDPSESVKNADVMGIWFGTDKEGLKLEKRGERCEGQVTAQVVITNELYNDFIGKIITLQNGEEEWSMFVGVPGNRYKKMSKSSKEGIETIAASFHLSDNAGEPQEPEYAVVIDGSQNNTKEARQSLSDNEIDTEVRTETQEETENDQTVAQISDNSVLSENEIPSANVTGPTSEEDKEGAQEESLNESTISDNIVPQPAETPQSDEGSIEEENDETKGNIDNPKKPDSIIEDTSIEFGEPEELETTDITDLMNKVKTTSTVKKSWDENKAYSSNIYSMLNVGQTGLLEAISKNNNESGKEQLMARITDIYDSKTTYEKIIDAEKIGASPFKYFDPPPGCHWESAIYAVNYAGSTYKPYINIKLVGADGNALKFRGIKYSSKTHDINTGIQRGTWVDNLMVYYAIPNGCTEYVLKIGDGDNINNWKSAYFYINRNKFQ